jgi:hypothetical protein
LELGTKISLGAHGALIGLAVFGGPLFDADESNAIQISEVSIISTEAFEGMMSSAPNPNVEEPQQSDLAQPDPVEDVPVVTEPVEQPVEEPAEPEVQEVAEPEPAPELDTEPAEPEVVEAPEAVQRQEATGSEIVAPDAQISEQDQAGQVDPNQLALLRPKPRPAPRISNEVVEKPPTDAERSEEIAEQTVPSDEPVEEVKPEETDEAAKPESTTEIVTEADEVDPNSAAPIKSSRPKGRPSDIVQKAQALKVAAEQAKADKLAADKAAEEAKKKAEAEAIEAAIKAANAEASKPSGPPLTGREKGALVLAVQQCWNPPIGVQNAADLKVTLLVELNEQGKLQGSPKLIEPRGAPSAAEKVAFDAGRRALIRCAPYSLPKEKYEQWRQIEVTFNPQNMVVR